MCSHCSGAGDTVVNKAEFQPSHCVCGFDRGYPFRRQGGVVVGVVRKGFFEEVHWNRDFNDEKEPCTGPKEE